MESYNHVMDTPSLPACTRPATSATVQWPRFLLIFCFGPPLSATSLSLHLLPRHRFENNLFKNFCFSYICICKWDNLINFIKIKLKGMFIKIWMILSFFEQSRLLDIKEISCNNVERERTRERVYGWIAINISLFPRIIVLLSRTTHIV